MSHWFKKHRVERNNRFEYSIYFKPKYFEAKYFLFNKNDNKKNISIEMKKKLEIHTIRRVTWIQVTPLIPTYLFASLQQFITMSTMDTLSTNFHLSAYILIQAIEPSSCNGIVGGQRGQDQEFPSNCERE